MDNFTEKKARYFYSFGLSICDDPAEYGEKADSQVFDYEVYIEKDQEWGFFVFLRLF